MKLVKKELGDFVEFYGTWSGYGYGVMLCYIEPQKCEYVMFRVENSYNKEVINNYLMDLYNKGNN